MDGFENLGARLGEGAAGNPDSRGTGVSATAEELGNFTDIDLIVFGTEGNADRAIEKFLEKRSHNDASDSTNVIDEVFAVFRFELEIVFDADGELPVGYFSIGTTLKSIEKGAE